jgi:Holliday junction resolvasome RuvABC endonuclease subunit
MSAIGIDPGKLGGIAVLDDVGNVIATHKMPETPRDLLDLLDGYSHNDPRYGQPRALIERVSASPQMGVVSAFTFGKGLGALEMALTAARIPFDWIIPAKWQQAMQCRSGGDKNITKRRAQQLFPHLTVTHAIADALLLAETCRRTHAGILQRGDSDGKKDSRKEARPRQGHPEPKGGRKKTRYQIHPARKAWSQIAGTPWAGAGSE